MYAQDSIELLKQSGIDFAQNEARGIDVHKFGELLMSSGIVLNEDVSAVCRSTSNPLIDALVAGSKPEQRPNYHHDYDLPTLGCRCGGSPSTAATTLATC